VSGTRSDWLLTTVNAVRERMVERLQKRSLDEETEREVQMALEEMETMWEELVGQGELLELERARYQEFFENAPDAYAVTDEGCGIREANRALAELLNLPRGELLGKALSRYVAEEDRGLFLTNVVSALQGAGSRPLRWRARLLPHDGAPVEVAVTVRAVPLRRSGVSGLCWLFRTDP